MAKDRRDSKNRVLGKGEYQKSDGRYMYRYTDINENVRYVYSWTLTKTDRTPKGKAPGPCLRDLEKEIAKDLHDEIDSYMADKATLNDYFDMYLERKINIKPTTKRQYKRNYDLFIRNTIGKRKIASLKYSDIKKCYCNILDERGMAIQSIKNIDVFLSPVLKMAVRDGLIRSNPASGVFSELRSERECQVQKKQALTVVQQNKFIDFLDRSNIYRKWKPLFVVMLGTGCRVGEICGLTWDDCDFAENVIHINRTIAYFPDEQTGKHRLVLQTPKTNSGIRTIPMLKDVRDVLMKERVRQMKDGFCKTEIDGVSGFVFFGRTREVLFPAGLTTVMYRLVEAHNKYEANASESEGRDAVFLPHLSPHILRHTFCTRLCESGMNIKVIQEVMGHANYSMTMNVYSSVTDEFKKTSFEVIEGAIRVC